MGLSLLKNGGSERLTAQQGFLAGAAAVLAITSAAKLITILGESKGLRAADPLFFFLPFAKRCYRGSAGISHALLYRPLQPEGVGYDRLHFDNLSCVSNWPLVVGCKALRVSRKVRGVHRSFTRGDKYDCFWRARLFVAGKLVTAYERRD